MSTTRRQQSVPKDWLTYADEYENFNAENLRASESLDGTGGGVSFAYFLIEYQYPNSRGSVYIEEHAQVTETGIVCKTYEGGNPTYTMTTKLRKDNPLDAKLIKVYQEIDAFCFRTALKMFSKKDVDNISTEVMDALTSEWRVSIFQSEDNDNEMILFRGLRDVKWKDRKTGADMTSRAIFSLPSMADGNDNSSFVNGVPWVELENKRFEFNPVVQFYRYFYGTTKCVKTSIFSGTICSEITESSGSAPTQTATKLRILKDNPDLVSKIHANAKRMALRNQNLGEVNSLFDNGEIKEEKEKAKVIKPPTNNIGIGFFDGDKSDESEDDTESARAADTRN